MYVISVPISVPVSKKKKFYLNLNQYRNAHHFTLSKAKTNYHDIVAPMLEDLPNFERINLVYTLFTGTEQLCDTSNICSIVDKFFSDVLVSCEKIVDDNRKVVLSAHYRWGGVDKHNPRVEVTIVPDDVHAGKPATEFNKEESIMQITINQGEIEEAIRSHILERITVKDNMRIDIDLKATRGDEGYTAIIDIVPSNSARRTSQAEQQEEEPVTSKGSSRSEPKAETSKPKAAAPKRSVFSGSSQAAGQASKDEAPAETETETSKSTDEGTAAIAEADPAVATSTEPETAVETETPAESSQEPAGEAPARPSLFAGLSKPSNA